MTRKAEEGVLGVQGDGEGGDEGGWTHLRLGMTKLAMIYTDVMP